jgi:aspartate/methionine/tyrosine aminotransferase
MTAAEGAALAAEAHRRGARFLVDEVYRDALVDPPPSATALGAIVTSSLTKSYGLGAIRFGWAIAPDAAGAAALQEISFGTIGAHAQPLLALGIAALERREALLAHARATLALNHALFAEACVAARGRIVPAPAPAGVIVWAELPGVPDAQLFAERLLAEQATLVSPGGFFGPPGCVRMGLGGDPEVVRAGLARLGAALA